MQLLVSPHCNLCVSSICRCPIGDAKLQTWQIHIWLNIFVFYWKMKLFVQVCVQKNKDNFLENMLDHCAKFCKRVTDVSMSSSSWQRNFNKTLNSCIIPEEKVKTPSLRCKYMYVHKTSFIERANWKPCSFSYWKKIDFLPRLFPGSFPDFSQLAVFENFVRKLSGIFYSTNVKHD